MSALLLDTAPLRSSPEYRRLWIGLTLAGVGSQLGVTAVALQVYDLTRSSLAVGMVGLVSFVPLVVLGLYGGALVDAYDRRRVVVLSSGALLVASVLIAAQAWLDIGSVGLLLGLVALQSAAFAVNSPARTAIVPMLVPVEQLPAANALSTLSMNLGVTVGPLLGGLLVGTVGFGPAYTIDVVTLLVALATVLSLPPLPPLGGARKAGLASVLEGLRLLRGWRNVRMTFLIDLAAMVLSQPRALFPAVGAVLIGGGATTAGVLASSVAVGSVLASLVSGPLGRVHRHGVAIAVSVAAWGASIVVFGLVLLLAAPSASPWTSWHLWAACAALAAAGAADAVSSVFRQTVLQSAAPDWARGRLQGVFIVVVAGGPRLGDLVAGADADALGEALAAVVGGLACVLAVVVLMTWQRTFLQYDSRKPVP
ncbi:Predicted arabinose efflux permease, MFS family [Quadrisphaera granulorum]|uniref:Putative MFS family arabinose efflux permease n=1 Tax=Quadrisphaera granulorum TaxID=317664 RepID=A0A316AE91_9ACTN|nr:MFS transporter [Quadrisphaera granulorum]PWJ55194.1 putative MFS family arabinose efflux permease [Quadrisphaera granulorum]SZE95703.1 Predicted arabinose efflux permease, MFS family [Quadrisphaera granulorum]